MKMTRKLIPALVMLLVSAMMLSTASYAWFASNNTVRANNLQVKVNSNAKFLVISDAADGTYGPSVTMANENAANKKEVDLVHAKIANDKKTVTWYVGDSTSATDPNAGALGDKNIIDDITDNYALMTTYYVKMSDVSTGALSDLKISGVTADGNSNLEDALRVLAVVRVNETDTVLAAQIWDVGTGALTADSATVLLDTVALNTVYAVELYLYYDGEDEEAYTDNTQSIDFLNVSVAFSAN